MISTALFYFILALLLALVEIEIEGKHGWAEKLPTWYRTEGTAAKIFGFFMNNRPLTGYHLFMLCFLIGMFHAHFFNGVPWTLVAEAHILSIYFMFAITWDFLWFILNPHYGLAKFKKTNIWWHARVPWVVNLFPIDYVVSIAISGVLASHSRATFEEYLINIGFFAIFLTITMLIAPVYHQFRAHLMNRDDRNKAHIFHNE